MTISDQNCALCRTPAEAVLWEDAVSRVIRVEGPEGVDYPGFCRVIWRAHVHEMSDLSGPDRHHLMALVFATESALRLLYTPDKINLASLGNLVPHLHWHVIPRFIDDPLFPKSIWSGPALRPAPAKRRAAVSDIALRQAITAAFFKEPGIG